jgi:hypothetical protein
MVPYSDSRHSYLIAAMFGVGELFTIVPAAAASIPALTPLVLLALLGTFAAIALLRRP